MAAADCTGHGVPGAFMTSLGIALFNEVINNCDENKFQTDLILDQPRTSLKEAFSISKTGNNLLDGMDVALCIIDFEERKIQFPGAYSPIVIIIDKTDVNFENKKRLVLNKIPVNGNYNFMLVKGDRMPIGYYAKERPFTKIDLDYQDGDRLYLFSDGIIDQYGKEENRRFLNKRFHKLLAKTHSLSFADQKQKLTTTLENWQQDLEQTGDITVIGIKLLQK